MFLKIQKKNPWEQFQRLLQKLLKYSLDNDLEIFSEIFPEIHTNSNDFSKNATHKSFQKSCMVLFKKSH